jgi:hemerythrin-like metal-binding protein
MALVNWRHEREVGSAEMDAQHQNLIAIINEDYQAVERKAPRAELQRVFAKVAHLATYHFGDEEALMEHAGFPRPARPGTASSTSN